MFDMVSERSLECQPLSPQNTEPAKSCCSGGPGRLRSGLSIPVTRLRLLMMAVNPALIRRTEARPGRAPLHLSAGCAGNRNSRASQLLLQGRPAPTSVADTTPAKGVSRPGVDRIGVGRDDGVGASLPRLVPVKAKQPDLTCTTCPSDGPSGAAFLNGRPATCWPDDLSSVSVCS
jgi:hypothetical protein